MFRFFLVCSLCLLLGCHQALVTPFSESRLQVARAHQAGLKQIQTELSTSTLKGLKAAKPDVQSVQWMTFDKLKQGALSAGVQRLDMTAKVFQFSFGKSWYKAFRLPQMSNPYKLVLYSYAKNGMGAGSIFYPTLVFVDHAFQITRVLTPQMNDNDSMLMKLTGEIMLKGMDHSQEAYVIVATSDALLQASTSMLSMASVGFGDIEDPYAETGIPKMQYVVHKRAHSPVGSMRVFWKNIEKDTPALE
ncbi:MAG: MalM family protein [Mariprofundaceae bacterium]|nr:MalM family protein [Mariprofundaceae bacterium]